MARQERKAAKVVPLPWVARRRARLPARQSTVAPADPDDYPIRDRTLITVAAFIVVLIVSSLWLLETMHRNTELEECLMTGRKNCTPVIAPLVDR